MRGGCGDKSCNIKTSRLSLVKHTEMAMTHLYSQAIDVHYKSETSGIVGLKACLFIISQDKQNDLYLDCPLSDPNSGVFMENCSQFDWWNPKMSKMEPKNSNCAGSQLWPSMLVLFLQKKLRKQEKVREVLFKIKKEKKIHWNLNEGLESIIPFINTCKLWEN